MTRSARSLDVMVVEDDPVLREVLQLHFAAEGWGVRVVADGPTALTECEARLPDVVVLDVMLPGRSGIEVCAVLRATYSPSPGVIFATARAGEVDVILGLEVGADDYVVKPYRPREVVARVRALARRVGVSAEAPPERPERAETPSAPEARAPVDDELRRGPLVIHAATRRVWVSGAAVKLTPSEFALLSFLARSPDHVFTRAQLLMAVWDSTHDGYQRNVDCHVTRLRKKLEAAGLGASVIETVHGVGYRFLPLDS